MQSVGELWDCQQWKKEGLELSTTSNEAARLFDASLTQYARYADDPTLGGLSKTLAGAQAADPNFILAKVIDHGINLVGQSKTARLNPDLHRDLDAMWAMAEAQSAAGKLSRRELLHATAVKQLGEGRNKAACDTWETILIDYPKDYLAIHLLQDQYFFLGDLQDRAHYSLSHLLPLWSVKDKLYPELLASYSFPLFELRRFEECERYSHDSLSLNPYQAWPVHSLAHCYEMTQRPAFGLAVLDTLANQWRVSTMVSGHMDWHGALFQIELQEYESALDIFDKRISPRVTEGVSATLDLIDGASLLYRLEMERVDVGGRWKKLYETCQPKLYGHPMPFTDIHYCMAYLRGAEGGDRKTYTRFMDSLRQYISDSEKGDKPPTDRASYYRDALIVCEALGAYEDGDYGRAADLLIGREWKIKRLGGSEAQRDMILQLTIHSAIRSKRHAQEAKRLVMEREGHRKGSALTERLLALQLASA